MKVEAIKSLGINNMPLKTFGHNKIVPALHEEEEQKQKVFASNICFKGDVPLAKLMNDYKWFIKHDKTPAIEAFLKLDASKESLAGALNYILKNEDTAYEFVDSIVTQPRRIKHYSKALQTKLAGTLDINNLFIRENPYTKAYNDYIDKRYKNAQSVSELLKIRPDWREEVLLAKHKELYHNNNFELGTVPDSIGVENFQKIINYLTPFMDYGFKTPKQIPDLTINGKTFKFIFITDGKSSKNVFLIETPNKEKFIIKKDLIENRGLNKPFANGTCAIIDRYLTENNCRNSAPLKYYNHNENTSIYDFITHKNAPKISYNLQDFVDKMPDFADLGLRHADTVGSNNYFILDNSQNTMKRAYDFNYGVKHGEFVSVDNDHVSYVQPLSPLSNKYHKSLPVEMQMFY